MPRPLRADKRYVLSAFSIALDLLVCVPDGVEMTGQLGVATNEGHFKDLLFELIQRPAQCSDTRTGGSLAADLMIMGFPMRLSDMSPPSLYVCHSPVGHALRRCSVGQAMHEA